MWVRRTLLPLALALALASCATVPAAANAQSEQPSEENPLPADSIVVEVRVHEDGSATFQVQYEYRLDDANRTRGFQRLKRRIESSEAYDRRVRRDFRQTVDVAENETGRNMAAMNVSVDARPHPIIEDYARVVHGFTWENFAAANGSRLLIGDALSGFWLPPHGELVLRWPEGYRAVDVAPSPDARDGREATWRTPEFEPDEPKVVLDSSTESADGPDVALSGLALAALLLALVAGVRYGPRILGRLDDRPLPDAVRAAVVGLPARDRGEATRRSDGDATRAHVGSDDLAPDDSAAHGPDAASSESAAAAPVAGNGDAGTPDDGAVAESAARASDAAGRGDAGSAGGANGGEPPAAGGAADGASAAGTTGAVDRVGAAAGAGGGGVGDAETTAETAGTDDRGGTADDGVARAPLTNEEQLRQVLDSHDGRVKQQRVAEATGWSDSKTSRVVRSLEEEDAVDVYRIGRENVVCYPEVDALDV